VYPGRSGGTISDKNCDSTKNIYILENIQEYKVIEASTNPIYQKLSIGSNHGC